MASLDEIPAATSGETTQVGFTILQHGETPVDLEERVGIQLTHPDGTVDYFVAAGDGVVGHYVATVTFPAAGSYEWTIDMGRFGPQPLGTIDVAAAASAGGSTGSFWDGARWVTLALAAALGAVAVADMAIGRRRRTATTT
jgi:hypothetical protein